MIDREVRIDILRQVENGQLSPEKASELLRHLEILDSSIAVKRDPSDEVSILTSNSQTNQDEPPLTDDDIKKPSWAFIFWLIPMFFGGLVTVTATSWLYQSYTNTGLSFRFWISWFPFLIGIGLIYLGFELMQARWLYVNIKQPEGEKPSRIFFGLPLPLRLLSGVFHLFRGKLPNDIKGMDIEGLLLEFEKSTASSSPLMINVDDEDGTKVEIYFG